MRRLHPRAYVLENIKLGNRPLSLVDVAHPFVRVVVRVPRLVTAFRIEIEARFYADKLALTTAP